MSETAGTPFRGMRISPELVILNLEANMDQEALEQLANLMRKHGLVTTRFLPAIQQREKDYCTGLKFEEMGIAIPHTMPEYVNQAAVAVATMKRPVQFHEMGTPENLVWVELIFMLAVQNVNDQLALLQTLMTVCQRPGFLCALKDSPTAEDLVERLHIGLARR